MNSTRKCILLLPVTTDIKFHFHYFQTLNTNSTSYLLVVISILRSTSRQQLLHQDAFHRTLQKFYLVEAMISFHRHHSEHFSFFWCHFCSSRTDWALSNVSYVHPSHNNICEDFLLGEWSYLQELSSCFASRHPKYAIHSNYIWC